MRHLSCHPATRRSAPENISVISHGLHSDAMYSCNSRRSRYPATRCSAPRNISVIAGKRGAARRGVCEDQHCYRLTLPRTNTTVDQHCYRPRLLQTNTATDQHCYRPTLLRTSTAMDQHCHGPRLLVTLRRVARRRRNISVIAGKRGAARRRETFRSLQANKALPDAAKHFGHCRQTRRCQTRCLPLTTNGSTWNRWPV